MALKRVPHTIDLGNNKLVLVTLPDEYAGVGASIGVTKVTGNPPAGTLDGDISSLIKAGEVMRIAVRCTDGVKKKRKFLLASIDKIQTGALKLLDGKTVGTATIVGNGVIPRRRVIVG